jgi:hypothetical protein
MENFSKLTGNWQSPAAMKEQQYTCAYCGSLTASTQGWGFQMTSNNLIEPSISIKLCSFCKQPTYFRGENCIPGVPFGKSVKHLPPEVQAMYEEARACTGANANTAAVLVCRKLLMHIAVAEGAKPGLSFKDYVDYLEKNNYLPPRGKDWVDHVRDKGNEANHEIVQMQKEDAQTLIGFLQMLLTFLYEFPKQVPAKPAAAASKP